MGYFYSPAEYLRPWKVACLLTGIAVLCVGSYLAPAPDWDIPITFIMAVCTYVTAPCTVRVFFARQWRLVPLAAIATWFSVDGVYALYWHFRDPEVLVTMRSANAPVSLALYLLCGVFCTYRGSLRELGTDIRAALDNARTR